MGKYGNTIKRRCSLEELREFCNTVRKAGAANPLDAILEAVPEEAEECLIARNLNFSCEVNGADLSSSELEDAKAILGEDFGDENPWAMRVESKELAENIANAIGSAYFGNDDDGFYQIILPEKIGNFAFNFDTTYQNLPYALLGIDEDGYVDEELIPLIDRGILDRMLEILPDDIYYGEWVDNINEAEVNEDILALISDNGDEVGKKINSAIESYNEELQKRKEELTSV